MRVIFMGTPEFAIPSLHALITRGYDVVAVLTQPDRPSGRGHRPQASPVKVLAQKHGLPVHQPEKVRSEEHRALFETLNADFIVVVAYGQILPAWLLRSARIAPVNVHGSLLPKYRGAAPVIWALVNGERVTGVTTMLMDEHLDTGPILLKCEVQVPDAMNAGELAGQLAHLGADLLIPTLEGLRDGTIRPIVQEEAQASIAPRISKGQAEISWSWEARKIHNRIRAFNPRPLAYTVCRGQRVQLLRSSVADSAARPGEHEGSYLGITESGMLIQCGENTALEILEVQPANRPQVTGREFANGTRVSRGTILFEYARSG